MDKVVQQYKADLNFIVTHCFIDKSNGMIYKPAGVNSRAAGARGNVLDVNSYSLADVNGTWLYGLGYRYK